MTHLGLVSAAGVALQGFDTVCYDGDAALVASLRAGRLPVHEPRLDELRARRTARARASPHDLADLGRCDVVYIAPDVPTDDPGPQRHVGHPRPDRHVSRPR